MHLIRVGGMACARVRVTDGPQRDSVLCAIDTGARFTLLPLDVARHLQLTMAGDLAMVSASQTERVSTAYADVAALGHMRRLRVMFKDLPSNLPFQGLLGLDFFEGRRLELDFAAGTVELS